MSVDASEILIELIEKSVVLDEENGVVDVGFIDRKGVSRNFDVYMPYPDMQADEKQRVLKNFKRLIGAGNFLLDEVVKLDLSYESVLPPALIKKAKASIRKILKVLMNYALFDDVHMDSLLKIFERKMEQGCNARQKFKKEKPNVAYNFSEILYKELSDLPLLPENDPNNDWLSDKALWEAVVINGFSNSDNQLLKIVPYANKFYNLDGKLIQEVTKELLISSKDLTKEDKEKDQEIEILTKHLKTLEKDSKERQDALLKMKRLKDEDGKNEKKKVLCIDEKKLKENAYRGLKECARYIECRKEKLVSLFLENNMDVKFFNTLDGAKYKDMKEAVRGHFKLQLNHFVFNQIDPMKAIKFLREWVEYVAKKADPKASLEIPAIPDDVSYQIKKNVKAQFSVLNSMDFRAPILGKLSGCCQFIGGEGTETAEQGMMAPKTGFYILEDKTKQKGSNNNIIAQSFVWLTEDGKTLVVDSIEFQGKYEECKSAILAAYKSIAKGILRDNPQIEKVLVGSSQHTKQFPDLTKWEDKKWTDDPKEEYFKVDGRDDFGGIYTDTKNLLLLCDRTMLQDEVSVVSAPEPMLTQFNQTVLSAPSLEEQERIQKEEEELKLVQEASARLEEQERLQKEAEELKLAQETSAREEESKLKAAQNNL